MANLKIYWILSFAQNIFNPVNQNFLRRICYHCWQKKNISISRYYLDDIPNNNVLDKMIKIIRLKDIWDIKWPIFIVFKRKACHNRKDFLHLGFGSVSIHEARHSLWFFPKPHWSWIPSYIRWITSWYHKPKSSRYHKPSTSVITNLFNSCPPIYVKKVKNLIRHTNLMTSFLLMNHCVLPENF